MNIIDWFKIYIKDMLFFVGLSIAIWAIYLLGKTSPISAITNTWLWILLVMVLFVLLASWLITGNPLFGWLINEQNRMSLSRLQMFLWTIVIMSAFVTAVFANLQSKKPVDEALSIAIPDALWLAMGISTASLVGSGLILQNKKGKDPTKLELKEDTSRDGVLATHTDTNPSLLDLIRGEELGNEGTIDLTRLQNLFFTFVLVGSYMASLIAKFTELATTPGMQGITDFPGLESSAIALLTISHAGYLAAKVIDKQPSEKTDPAAAAPARPAAAPNPVTVIINPPAAAANLPAGAANPPVVTTDPPAVG